MSRWINTRRLTAVFCLALLLLATFIPSGSGLLFAILTPLWLFLAAVVLLAIQSGYEVSAGPNFFVPQIYSSRAPPILSSL